MISNRIAMRLVANHLNQTQHLRIRIKIDGLVFASLHEKVSDLVVMQRRFDHTNHRHGFEIEHAHRFRRRVQLRFAAVDHDEIRQSFFFVAQAAITA